MARSPRRRKFNRAERMAILEAAGGICEICGKDVTTSMEADHKIPWIKGGITDVVNGQCLCPEHNREKGAK